MAEGIPSEIDTMLSWPVSKFFNISNIKMYNHKKQEAELRKQKHAK